MFILRRKLTKLADVKSFLYIPFGSIIFPFYYYHHGWHNFANRLPVVIHLPGH